ncbi:hypothetical protein [Methanoregula sp.]|jgi:hypothetical protein|uniref:hypothetical protein n=1 Tax=Methanoregula sp. TaxID=2052170 RepID=UPI003D0B9D4D
MSQIFISHSQKDDAIIALFAKAFGSTHVKHVFMEYEKIMLGREIMPQEIQMNIKNSMACFVILSENVNTIKHTRDWIVAESSLAYQLGKDIWIFEPNSDLGKIDVIIPFFTHIAPFDICDEAYVFIRNIIESYEGSTFLGAVSGNKKKRPRGIKTQCFNCHRSFQVYIRYGSVFRCPGCNQHLQINK